MLALVLSCHVLSLSRPVQEKGPYRKGTVQDKDRMGQDKDKTGQVNNSPISMEARRSQVGGSDSDSDIDFDVEFGLLFQFRVESWIPISNSGFDFECLYRFNFVDFNS